jgi:crotonobetainyl-CoA:carnitine CoA-transferase CaiB-like acyl-CoA transferase
VPPSLDAQLLQNVTVLEWGEFVSVPTCGRLLADLGAEVIKLEPPDGDIARKAPPFVRSNRGPEASALFQHLNLGKRGITLDVSSAKELAQLHTLLDRVDVLVEGQRPALMDALGLDHASLRKRHPRLNVVSVTPFGKTGPYRDRHGADIVVWAMSGIATAHPRYVPEPHMQPLAMPGYAADTLAGYYAASTVMAALVRQWRTGKPSLADLSALDLLLSILHVRVAGYDYEGKVIPRVGETPPSRTVPWGLYPCKDGYVGLFVVQDAQWQGLIRAMGKPDWAQTPLFANYNGRAENGPELTALLQTWLDAHSMLEVYEACMANDVPSCAIVPFKDVERNPQLLSRKAWESAQHPRLGKLPVLRPPYRWAGQRWSPTRFAPKLGEHNKAILGSGASP